MNHPSTVSLFCGAGGESLGKHLAFEELGIPVQDMTSHALNHWDLAVATHGRNFPWIQVHQEDITAVTAADYGLEHINLLWASPSCVHHSRARGGKPKEEQQRSHAWEVVDRWLRVARVDVLLVENVPEFQDWGPLDEAGQPIKERKGEDFRAFVADLQGLGYQVEWRVLCAADYGDPTIRRRFFLQAVRDGLPIVWPEPTHRDPRKGAGLFDAALPPWRTAAECIDWSLPVPSIFDRKRPLAAATLRRIAAGVMRFVVNGRPFIVNLTHGGRLEDVDEPLKTITTATRGEKAIILPSLVGVGGRAGQSAPRGFNEPMGTGTTKADTALVAASMVSLRGTAEDQIQASAGSVEAPLPTVSAGGGHAALVSAFLAKHYGGVVGSSLDGPIGTVTAVDHHSVVAASLIQTGYGERKGQAPRVLDIESPLGTVVAGGSKHGLVAAFLQQYYSTGGQHQEASEPLHAVTTVDRHSLVTVEIDGETYVITDIGMRMLEPRELARAMGFPEWFSFEGLTKRDTVKMIGNACPVGTVKALIKAVVVQRPHVFIPSLEVA
jgi:DNA (cytosine-5)-methyltransferase 1